MGDLRQGELFGGRGWNPNWNICREAGCTRPSRTRRGWMCNAHYQQGRKKGTLRDTSPIVRKTSHGYLYMFDKTHPIASDSGHLYLHRKILWDEIGIGWHKCHWCPKEVSWITNLRGQKLVVDHIDNDPANNALDNLVPSCHSCNYGRGIILSFLKQRKDSPELLLQLRKWIDALIDNIDDDSVGGLLRHNNRSA